MAALAADRQGKFWEFHDELFKNYNKLNDQKIQEIARQLGLNESVFNSDQRSRTLANRIQEDYEEGIKMGVRGTPTIFVNGKPFRQQRSMKNMEALINQELKSVKASAPQQ